MRANGSSRRVITVICVAATLSAGLAAPAAAGEWRGTGDQRRLQAAVDDLHGLGITGVQGLTRIDGRTSRARAGVGVSPDGNRVAVLALTTQLASDSEVLPVYHRQFHLLNTTICD